MDFTHVQQRIKNPTTKANNKRAYEIERFVKRLNEARKLSGYKKLSPAFYATKMSHISTEELHAFYKKLDQSKNFSALWWWHCQPKK